MQACKFELLQPRCKTCCLTLPAMPQIYAVQGRAKSFEKAMLFHQNLVRAVAADPHLKQLAADAFRSFVRAYSTHSKVLKGIFAVHQLHLGHVAHSFALRCATAILDTGDEHGMLVPAKTSLLVTAVPRTAYCSAVVSRTHSVSSPC